MRRLLSSLGVRYRLHRRDLPGRPDLYIGRLRLALFVNGCFWHGHACRRGRLPKINAAYWNDKIQSNVARDRRSLGALKANGVGAMMMWICRADNFPRRCRAIAKRYHEMPR